MRALFWSNLNRIRFTVIKMQVLPEDEGEYACEAVNDAGHAITKAFLSVEREFLLQSIH